MKDIQSDTIQFNNIVVTEDGFYRYVNHYHKIATTGFRTKSALINNQNLFRFDDATILLMQDRYSELYS